MPCSPRRRIRLVTVIGELAVLPARLGDQNLRRLDTSNGCQDHTVLPSVVVHFSHPLTLPDNSPLPTKNARPTVIFRCHTRNAVALRDPQWHRRYTAGPLLGRNYRHGRTADRDFRKGLKPPPRGERFFWDTELTGFAIKIFAPTKAHPKGARTFVLSYWINGSERRYRIGSWPDWSVMAARAEAREIRQRVDRGEDPAGDRRARREAPTLAELAARYKAEHLPRKAPQSQHDDGVMLGHILRHIGADAKVVDVHHGDIVALHRAITDSGHPVLANRTVSCASRMFSLALKPMAGENKPWRDQAQGNPCKGIERNPGDGQGDGS